MNKQQFYTLGGALLASTALTSGAMAGTPGLFNQAGTSFVSTNPLKVANTVFSATPTTADLVPVGAGLTAGAFGVAFTNVSNIPPGLTFNADIIVTGALPSAGTVTAAQTILISRTGISTANTFVGTVDGTGVGGCASVGAIGATIFAQTCATTASSGLSIGGISFSGLQFTNANGLATTGGSISLSGRVYNPLTNATYDTITSGTLVTSVAPVATTITAGSNVIASTTSTPNAFTYLSATQASPGGLTVYTVVLASVVITATSSLLTNDLNTPIVFADTQYTSLQVTVTSAEFSGGAAAIAQLNLQSPLGTATLTSTSAVNFSGGAQTFDIQAGGGASAFTIVLALNGTGQIAVAASGSVALKFGGTATGQAPAAPAAGSTASFSRGGFNGEVNTLFSSAITKAFTTAYASYVRIHNNGAISGPATVTIRHDADGSLAGTSFTTSTILAGSTLQLSAAQMETAAGITTPVIETYTVQVTGPILGYIQHVVYNPTTNQINDMSAFRNAGALTPP